MEANRYEGPAEFLTAITSAVERDPGRWTIVNTVLHSQIAAPFSEAAPLLIAVTEPGGEVVAAALQTPPYPLTVVSCGDASVRTAVLEVLLDAVVAESPMVTTISGPTADVEYVAVRFAARTNSELGMRLNLVLHRLGTYRPPVGIIGSAREALPSNEFDVDLISRWWFDFAVEAGTHPRPTEVDPEVLRRRELRGHRTMLWCVEGEPVAAAGAGAVVGGTVRIGPVYTSPARRGRHYGSAVTAAAVDSALLRGATGVELFTDAANPTSNNVYRRLGFEPGEPFVEVEIHPSPGV